LKYRVVIDVLAQRDIDDFYKYLRRYSENTARKHVEAFYDVIEQTIAVFPHSFAFFAEMGAPYKAFLFTISRRTAYWVV
jgi:plasmid stabilization system protein ParE